MTLNGIGGDNMTANPFTPQQLADICRFLAIIRDMGGHGEIVVVVRENEVRFINLGEVSKKYEREVK